MFQTKAQVFSFLKGIVFDPAKNSDPMVTALGAEGHRGIVYHLLTELPSSQDKAHVVAAIIYHLIYYVIKS